MGLEINRRCDSSASIRIAIGHAEICYSSKGMRTCLQGWSLMLSIRRMSEMKAMERDEVPLGINAFTLIPNQKYRRSCRHLQSKKNGDRLESFHLQYNCGYFQIIPIEIFHKVLCYLSVTDISILSMVSKVVGTQIVGYISTSSGIKRLLLEGFHSTDISKKSIAMEHYRSLVVNTEDDFSGI
ncbi:F-box only protein 47-like isoform X2 [Chiloscyllium punctatum]|uniref:F-box only protein 47-like isoform X2 n=1 Tax=Chiloscyllium punctatum TaxID=137246 RepID=UPI003B635A44